MVNGRVKLGSGPVNWIANHNGQGKKWVILNGLKTGWVNWAVGQVGLYFSH